MAGAPEREAPALVFPVHCAQAVAFAAQDVIGKGCRETLAGRRETGGGVRDPSGGVALVERAGGGSLSDG